jgi:hypothetical protein
MYTVYVLYTSCRLLQWPAADIWHAGSSKRHVPCCACIGQLWCQATHLRVDMSWTAPWPARSAGLIEDGT